MIFFFNFVLFSNQIVVNRLIRRCIMFERRFENIYANVYELIDFFSK